MILNAVYVRFYKSFNFDYLRKYDRKRETEAVWDHVGDLFYPYVRIPIDPKITTVVGANESGKTHLLTAIEKGLSGNRIKRDDFCRYSVFFSMEEDKMRWPDFGFEWAELTDPEREAIGTACGVAVPPAVARFWLFRTNKTDVRVYLPSDNGPVAHKAENPEALIAVLPAVLRLRENIALPEAFRSASSLRTTAPRRDSPGCGGTSASGCSRAYGPIGAGLRAKKPSRSRLTRSSAK